MTVLMGPADADHYRVKIGRYRDRWYTDPLPGCDIAEASDWHGPSVSATKPPFANKYVPMRAIADMPTDDWKRLATKEPDARYEAIKTHEKQVSQANMKRGGIVHKWAEDRLLGHPINTQFLDGPVAAQEQALRFLPALESFFDTYQPELVACEVVCLHRTLNDVGYGGTSDAFIRVESDVWCVDWKSRNSDHDAYPDEAGQGGAYIGAEYMIITGPDGNPTRVKVPAVAGVLIVSIREDGFRTYPIDAQGAIDHYHEMHRWWTAQQQLTANKVIGRPWAPKTSVAAAADDGDVPPTSSTSSVAPSAATDPTYNTRRNRLLERYRSMNDREKMAYCDIHIDPNNLDAIETALNQVDSFARVIPPAPVVTSPVVEPPTPPDEGDTVADTDVKALQKRFEKLPLEGSLWTGRLVAEGKTSHDFRIKDRPTVRRYEIYRGILALAEWSYGNTAYPEKIGDEVDDYVKAICQAVWCAPQPNLPAGQLLGQLDFAQAIDFARTAIDLTQDRYHVHTDEDGTLRIVAATTK